MIDLKKLMSLKKIDNLSRMHLEINVNRNSHVLKIQCINSTICIVFENNPNFQYQK